MHVYAPYIGELLALPILPDASAERRLTILYTLSNQTEAHYHPVSLPKKNGGRRRLLVPDALLKQVQRQILHGILERMPVSPYATAYHPGAAIVENASVHLGQPQILKLDIRDFFSSILFPDVLSACFASPYFSAPVGTLLTNLCCYRGYLPQGAPTSPAVSNLVLRPFDECVGQWCAAQQIVYTRYCDDLTFSGDFNAAAVKQRVGSYLQVMGFSLQEKKTRLLSAHSQQRVTGIVVNEKLQVPRQYRRRLRQEIYYCDRYGVQSHLAAITGREVEAIQPAEIRQYLQSLLGKIHFVLQVNPQDASFQQSREQVTAWLQAVRYNDGIISPES